MQSGAVRPKTRSQGPQVRSERSTAASAAATPQENESPFEPRTPERPRPTSSRRGASIVSFQDCQGGRRSERSTAASAAATPQQEESGRQHHKPRNPRRRSTGRAASIIAVEDFQGGRRWEDNAAASAAATQQQDESSLEPPTPERPRPTRTRRGPSMVAFEVCQGGRRSERAAAAAAAASSTPGPEDGRYEPQNPLHQRGRRTTPGASGVLLDVPQAGRYSSSLVKEHMETLKRLRSLFMLLHLPLEDLSAVEPDVSIMAYHVRELEDFLSTHEEVIKLVEEHDELVTTLEQRLSDSTRLSNRGGNLLAEERERNQVAWIRKQVADYISGYEGPRSRLFMRWEAGVTSHLATSAMKTDPPRRRERSERQAAGGSAAVQLPGPAEGAHDRESPMRQRRRRGTRGASGVSSNGPNAGRRSERSAAGGSAAAQLPGPAEGAHDRETPMRQTRRRGTSGVSSNGPNAGRRSKRSVAGRSAAAQLPGSAEGADDRESPMRQTVRRGARGTSRVSSNGPNAGRRSERQAARGSAAAKLPVPAEGAHDRESPMRQSRRRGARGASGLSSDAPNAGRVQDPSARRSGDGHTGVVTRAMARRREQERQFQATPGRSAPAGKSARQGHP